LTPNPVDFNEFIQKLLFTNDATVVDSFNRTKTASHQSPEQELWFEVLREAIDDYTENIDQETSSQKRLFEEVFEWLFNEHHSRWPMSFENICETLDIEVSYSRRLLIEWTQRHFAQTTSPPPVAVAIPSSPNVTYPKFVSIESIL